LGDTIGDVRRLPAYYKGMPNEQRYEPKTYLSELAENTKIPVYMLYILPVPNDQLILHCYIAKPGSNEVQDVEIDLRKTTYPNEEINREIKDVKSWYENEVQKKNTDAVVVYQAIYETAGSILPQSSLKDSENQLKKIYGFDPELAQKSYFVYEDDSNKLHLVSIDNQGELVTYNLDHRHAEEEHPREILINSPSKMGFKKEFRSYTKFGEWLTERGYTTSLSQTQKAFEKQCQKLNTAVKDSKVLVLSDASAKDAAEKSADLVGHLASSTKNMFFIRYQDETVNSNWYKRGALKTAEVVSSFAETFNLDKDYWAQYPLSYLGKESKYYLSVFKKDKENQYTLIDYELSKDNEGNWRAKKSKDDEWVIASDLPELASKLSGSKEPVKDFKSRIVIEGRKKAAEDVRRDLASQTIGEIGTEKNDIIHILKAVPETLQEHEVEGNRKRYFTVLGPLKDSTPTTVKFTYGKNKETKTYENEHFEIAYLTGKNKLEKLQIDVRSDPGKFIVGKETFTRFEDMVEYFNDVKGLTFLNDDWDDYQKQVAMRAVVIDDPSSRTGIFSRVASFVFASPKVPKIDLKAYFTKITATEDVKMKKQIACLNALEQIKEGHVVGNEVETNAIKVRLDRIGDQVSDAQDIAKELLEAIFGTIDNFKKDYNPLLRVLHPDKNKKDFSKEFQLLSNLKKVAGL